MGIKSKLRRLVQRSPWGSVQFYHQQNLFRVRDSRDESRRFTVAVAMPTKSQLTKLQERLLRSRDYEHPKVTLRVGKATVNPKDQYTRQIGRKVSFDRIAPHSFYLNQVDTKAGESIFNFTGVIDNQITTLYLTLIPSSDRAQLRHVSFRKLPKSIQEVANAKSEEVSTGTQGKDAGAPIRSSLRDERGGDSQSDSERRTFGVGLQEQSN